MITSSATDTSTAEVVAPIPLPEFTTESQGPIRNLDDLLDRIRQNNHTLLGQSQRIEELESVLTCITHLSAKVRRLEAEQSS